MKRIVAAGPSILYRLRHPKEKRKGPKQYHANGLVDQPVMNFILVDMLEEITIGAEEGLDLGPRVTVVPTRAMNSFCRPKEEYRERDSPLHHRLTWHLGDPFVHFNGINAEERLLMMTKLLETMQTNETNADHLERNQTDYNPCMDYGIIRKQREHSVERNANNTTEAVVKQIPKPKREFTHYISHIPKSVSCTTTTYHDILHRYSNKSHKRCFLSRGQPMPLKPLINCCGTCPSGKKTKRKMADKAYVDAIKCSWILLSSKSRIGIPRMAANVRCGWLNMDTLQCHNIFIRSCENLENMSCQCTFIAHSQKNMQIELI